MFNLKSGKITADLVYHKLLNAEVSDTDAKGQCSGLSGGLMFFFGPVIGLLFVCLMPLLSALVLLAVMPKIVLEHLP